MPATWENEHDNAGPSYTPEAKPRGLLAALGLRRSPPVPQHAPTDGATAVVPLAPYDVHVQPGVNQMGVPGPMLRAFAPGASANTQAGAYVVPYGAPTQVHAMVVGVQLRCGVETIRRQFLTPFSPAAPAGTPFFQQTMRPSFPVMTTRDGGRPGATVGPAGTALAFGKVRDERTQAAQGLAAGLLGW